MNQTNFLVLKNINVFLSVSVSVSSFRYYKYKVSFFHSKTKAYFLTSINTFAIY